METSHEHQAPNHEDPIISDMPDVTELSFDRLRVLDDTLVTDAIERILAQIQDSHSHGDTQC